MEPAGGAATVAAQCYPDSVDSSPRSRNGESWDDPFPSSGPSLKLRLMCSYGGRIVPRPTDKSLCYLGGETRIVVVDRHSSLADLSSRLSRSLLGGRPFSLKYQLPDEDLDALVSVTSDEDLDNMIDEHDRFLRGGGSSSRSSRIRLFLFPSKLDSAASSIGSGSLLEDSNSETWFVDALNSAGGGLPRRLSGDSASVNCLLGLEDDSSTHSRAGRVPPPPEVEQPVLHRPDSSGRLPSVSDSPILETTSSFGSTSSAPSLSTLPPIRVHPEDRSLDPRVGGLDEHFSRMNISTGTAAAPIHPPPPPITLATVSATTPSISPSETNRVFSDDEKSDKSDHAAARKTPAPPPIQSQLPPKIEPPMPESLPRPIYANPISDSKREAPPPRMPPPPSIQATDPSYILPSAMPPEQHRHQHQPQQYIPANPHYLHHQASATMVPIQSYYQIPQQSQHFDSQIHPMYYLPIRPNPSPPLSTPTTIPIPTATPAAAPRPPIVPTGMAYHMVSNYSYEYPAADPSHGQMYYAQPTSSPAQRPPSDAKPTRAS